MTRVGFSLVVLFLVGLVTVNGVCEKDSKYDFSPVLHGSRYARLCWKVTTKVGAVPVVIGGVYRAISTIHQHVIALV